MGGHPPPHHGLRAAALPAQLRPRSLFGMVTDEQCDTPLLTRPAPTPRPGHGQTRPLLRLKKRTRLGVLSSAWVRNESGEHSPVPRWALLLQFGLLGAVPTVLLCWCCHLPQFPFPTLSRWVCVTGFEADNDAGHVIAAGAIP